jgi:SAM-dependent methyltransferase
VASSLTSRFWTSDAGSAAHVVCPSPQERFDLAMSRFGTMFFDDPVAAFGNVGRALRAAGRLVMMVWQAPERNEWEVAIRQSLETAGSAGSDAFSLADPPAVTGILEAAGFADVAFTDVHEPVYYGPDVAAALGWVRGFRCISDVLDRLAPDAARRALGRLREMLAAHPKRRRGLVRFPGLDRQRPPSLNLARRA